MSRSHNHHDNDEEDDGYEQHSAAVTGPRVGSQALSGNLESIINVKQSQVLNATHPPSLARVLVSEGAAGTDPLSSSLLYSDASTDSPQLMVTVEFNEAVRIEALVIQAISSGSVAAAAAPPRSVKLFVKQPNYSFDDCETQKASFETNLTESQLQSTPIKLPLARFASVNSITLFFPANTLDAATTFVNRIAFYGVPLAGTKMSDLRPTSCC